MRFGVEHLQKKSRIVIKVGVVILSRYSSSRLPGKALMEIEGKKVLEYIIERVNQVFPLTNIILATSDDSFDDRIANFAKEYGMDCYRGSLNDVAIRFIDAAESKGWDYAIRLNGDNIFAEIELLREVERISSLGIYDFISNVKGRTFPKGMSVESVRIKYFKSKLTAIKQNINYLEHVTLYFYEHEEPQYFYFIYNEEFPELAGMQLALDTEEDFKRTEYIVSKFDKPHFKYNIRDINTIIKYERLF